MLGITRETLRHYEKENIIHPQVDEENHYRYYDDYQLYLIAECKRYQLNEFSLGEIREMMQNSSLQDYIGQMEKKQEMFERKVQLYWQRADLTLEYLIKLKLAADLKDRIFVSFQEEMILVPQIRSGSLRLDSQGMEASRWIMDNLENSFMMAYFDDCQKDEWQWGFGKRVSHEPRKEDMPELIRIEGSCVVSAIMDIREEWQFHNSICTPLLSWAEARGLTPRGQFYMRHLVRTSEQDGIHRYFEGFLPIRETDPSLLEL